jgi:hypothetical protein
MNGRQHEQWLEDNQAALSAEFDWLQALLENSGDENASPAVAEPPESTAPTLDYLSAQFGLSSFERSIVLLCAGAELNSALLSLCGAEGPTFGMALAALPDAHWNALSPASPLRHWQLVRAGGHGRITTARLSLDERILHFLLGAGNLDERLSGLVRPLVAGRSLPASQQLQVDRLVSLWEGRETPPVILIQGKDPVAGREVAGHACARLGMQVLVLQAQDIDPAAGERGQMARLLSREFLLSNAALMIDGGNEAPRQLTAFMEQLDCPLMLVGDPPDDLRRNSASIEVDKPTTAEQRVLWKDALGGMESFEEAWLLPLAVQFDFSSLDIRTAVESIEAEQRLGAPLRQALWQNCRQLSRGGLGRLAQRITPRAGWDDLVLPGGQKSVLRDISRQVHHRATVYEAWGFASKSERGLGISALFSGESGTGKTMAAEVLAGELDLDLYRIDLSSVVSKYIGETEKNLERLFRAAETSGAILLFDEADALFGKRSDVKDSHDRYANIELAYLLQRMEAYRGLSILTSNMKSSLDTAFLRRIRFVVQFPFPDLGQRNEIWRRVLPDSLPRTELRTEQLARLHVAGGNIRNIAMNAAFIAAEKGDPMCMADLAHATRMEFAKLEKPLNESELRNWT